MRVADSGFGDAFRHGAVKSADFVSGHHRAAPAMRITIDSRPRHSPATPSGVASNTTARSVPRERPAVAARAPSGPGGPFVALPSDIHHELARRLPMPDVARLARTGRAMHASFGADSRAFGELKAKIAAASDLLALHQLTGMGTAGLPSERRQVILGWSPLRQEELFEEFVPRMNALLDGLSNGTQANLHGAVLATVIDHCIAVCSRMRPGGTAATGIIRAMNVVILLPGNLQQGVFDRALAAARGLPPDKRRSPLLASARAAFRVPVAGSPDPVACGQGNIIDILQATDRMKGQDLQSVLACLAECTVVGPGDWMPSFDAMVAATDRLCALGQRKIRRDLQILLDSLDSPRPADKDAAKSRQDMLEPRRRQAVPGPRRRQYPPPPPPGWT